MIDLWYLPSTPGTLKSVPWLHADAIAYLESLLEPYFTVAEQGCGGSSLWLAERVKHVFAFDGASNWVQAVSAKAPNNCHVNYWKNQSAIPWRTIEQVGLVDLAFIDGSHEGRKAWLSHITEIVRPGGFVVLDNANRPEYAKEREHLKSRGEMLKRFDNNVRGSLYFVTEFWRLWE